MEYEKTVNEHYRPFWEQGIAVDVIDADARWPPLATNASARAAKPSRTMYNIGAMTSRYGVKSASASM
jgi:beta-galactosidase GanA